MGRVVVKRNQFFLFFLFIGFSLFLSRVYSDPLGETEITYTTPGLNSSTGVTGNIVLRETGTTCSADSQCQSGYCCSSICSATACTTTTASQPSAGVIVGPSAPGAATTTTTTTTTTTIQTTTTTTLPLIPVIVTPVQIPITNEQEVNEIIQGVDASLLNVSEVTSTNVEVTQIGVAETSFPSNQVQTLLDAAISSAITDEVKQILQDIKDKVASGESIGLPISSKLSVFEIKSKDTGKITYVSKIELILIADKDYKSVSIVEVMPKTMAADISEVLFVGVPPNILQSDPIAQWQFGDIKQGETKDLSYLIKKKLDKLESYSAITAQAPLPPVTPPAFPDSTILIIIIVVFAAVLVFILVWAFKPKKTHREYPSGLVVPYVSVLYK